MHGNQRQTLLIYTAGIMDADGCFMILKQKRKTKTGISKRSLAFPKCVDEWSASYMPAVKISMIEEEAVKAITEELEYGKYKLEGARKSRPNSKRIYHWYMRDRLKVEKFLEEIIPFLRVKTKRAEHLLKFCNHLNSQKNPCYRSFDKSELKYREDSYLKMRELNGTKVAATTESSGPERVSDSLIS